MNFDKNNFKIGYEYERNTYMLIKKLGYFIIGYISNKK
ncbi:hypothetical protein QEW_0883 [Clostridioides difficile CD160]|nr:hypothetical protein QEW_0883 [Clostridioides difficile CD160]